MVKQITLTHSEPFSCDVHIDDVSVMRSKNKKHHTISLKNRLARLKIYITPFKIQPLIRFDGHLVNYGLAKILPWDHMLEFEVSDDYLDNYFKEIIGAKEKYLSVTGQNIPSNMENYVGINNENPELVAQIKDLLK
jgi:hypothetical protein